MLPQPVVTMDPASWNDEWESEENEGTSPVESDTHLEPQRQSSHQYGHNERSSSGWLQDVFEGVRLTAVQSGQEILQVSSVLTSGIIQRALPKPSASEVQPAHSCISDFNEIPPSRDPAARSTSSLPIVNDNRIDQLSPTNSQLSASIETDSWNEEWDSTGDDSHPESPTIADVHSNQSTPLFDGNRRQHSGWFQDVLEGVRITALQSGQEIMQVSTELTSEMISKTLSRSHEAKGPQLPDAPNVAISGTASPLSGSITSTNFNMNAISDTDRTAVNPDSWNNEWDVEDNNSSSSPSRNNIERVFESISEERQGGAGWLQDVFQGVRVSAVQSGQEILYASGALTSDVFQKAKDFVPFREASETNQVFRLENVSAPASLRATSSPSHTLNEMFSGSAMMSAINKELPDDHYSDRSTLINRSFTETSEFLWNFSSLQTFEIPPSDASFDSLFNLYGGTESEYTLDKLGCENIIRLERMQRKVESDERSAIEDINNQVFQGDDSVSLRSTLVSNMKRLNAEILDWYRDVLKQGIVEDRRDVFLILDQLHSSSTRSLAILSARSVHLLLHSVQQWTGNSEQSRMFAAVLRRFMVSFNQGTNFIGNQTMEFAQRFLSVSSAHEDDIDILRADIEVDIFQAKVKIEDAINNVIPILQCMALSN